MRVDYEGLDKKYGHFDFDHVDFTRYIYGLIQIKVLGILNFNFAFQLPTFHITVPRQLPTGILRYPQG